MSDNQPSLGRDILGVVVFALGALLGVSVAMCYLQGVPAEQVAGVTPIDVTAIGWLGRPGALVLAVGLAWIGARLFLNGPIRGLARHLVLGVLGTSLGTSILFGAIKLKYGGEFGTLIGTWATVNLTRFVSIPLGILCVFVPVWFAWLRPRDVADWNPVLEPEPNADRSTESSEGVTAEEALELIPRRVVKIDRPTPIASVTNPHSLDTTIKKAPLASGARPHEPTTQSKFEEHQGRVAPLSEFARTARPIERNPVDQDLALAEPDAVRGTKKPAVLEPIAEGEEVGPAEPLKIQAVPRTTEPTPVRDPEPAQRDASIAPPAQRPTGVEELASEPLPPPSWEQSDLFQDDEPVDAYGTPLKLIEELRGTSLEEPSKPEPATSEAELEEAAREAGVSDDESVELAPTALESKPIEAADDEEQLEDEELDLALAEDELEEDEDQEDEDLEAGSFEDDEAELDPEDEESTFELSAEIETIEVITPASPIVESAPSAKSAERELDADEKLRREAPLFAAPLAAEPKPSEVAKERDTERDTERDIVLQPKAAPVAEPAPKVAPATKVDIEPTELSEEDELVYKAGLLILDRQRVAVSMLQREYGIDFEQATKLLDRLQAAGLIGPYLGGQRRDILLTLDQWRGRTVAQ